MDNSEDQVGTVIVTNKFGLQQSPVAVQLTIHVTNLVNQYGPIVTRAFKAVLNESSEADIALDSNFRIKQIIEHYGFEVVREWFTEIYGWKYERAA